MPNCSPHSATDFAVCRAVKVYSSGLILGTLFVMFFSFQALGLTKVRNLWCRSQRRKLLMRWLEMMEKSSRASLWDLRILAVIGQGRIISFSSMRSAMVRSRICSSESKGSNRYLHKLCECADASISMARMECHQLASNDSMCIWSAQPIGDFSASHPPIPKISIV